MKIFDTLTGKKVEFEPIEKGVVKMYVCGPTVYDNAHLGHGRSAVSFDVIRRYFLYKGFEVKYVSNYTDIDDKMITRANKEGISVSELADKVIPEYERDYGALGVMKPDVQPKATEYIDAMIYLVQELEAKGFAYELDDGIYYDVSKFAAYGKLSKQKLEDLEMGSRVAVKDNKRNPYDFVLWKFKKDGEPFWNWPGNAVRDGRPGWHIECSAMTWKNLGEKFDIHGGGLDLTFPHHECEIAQSEAVFGEGTFSKYWLHNGFINVDNEKMSKSLGNFFTLKDIFKEYDPTVVRFMLLQTHYRNPVNFSHALLDQAKAGLARIHDFIRGLQAVNVETLPEDVGRVKRSIGYDEFSGKFSEFMDNDFDTAGALGVLFELITCFNGLKVAGGLVKDDYQNTVRFLEEIDTVFAFIFPREEILDPEVDILIKEREEARKNKDFAKSDELRAKLLEKGIVVEDTKDGTIWKKA
ncbi:MAG: cysteine--tRNA ligase [Patescibacteria group bacterium]